MPRKVYTILILPHARSRMKKIHVSRNFLLAVAAILGTVVLVGGFTPQLAFLAKSRAHDIDRLQQERADLVAERQRVEQTLNRLQERLAGFEERAGRIAGVLGVEELPSSDPAAGGGSLAELPGRPLQALEEDLDVLDRRLGLLGDSMDRLDDAWSERMRRLAATPDVRPVPGFFSHGYGWRKDPFTGRREFHQGVDIVADRGTSVIATADGVVSRAERYMGYGKMVHLSHGYGMATRYAHLSEILVRPGQRVRRGDVIGRVGSTGRSTGPHLHYEVFRAGRRVDPRRYLGDKNF